MHQRRYFGTDGIRDVANRGNLSTEMILRIGHAIGHVVRLECGGTRRPRVLLVRDTRVSGPMISGILTGSLLAHGIDVYDAGVLPTPACALLVRRQAFDLGIVVSASHNPMADNGVKLFGRDGRKLSDVTEVEIERWIERPGSADVLFVGAELGRLVHFHEGESLYLEMMVQEFFSNLDLSGMRLVVDCAHGAAFRTAPKILAALGAQVRPVNNQPDGININEKAGVFHAGDMASVMTAERAHAGIALDGDGDRVILADDTGAVRDGDDILSVLAGHLPATARRNLVVTVMSNMGLISLAKKLGLEVHQTPVGDRYVAEKMEESGAFVGGEQSGHVIFHDAAGWFGDGIFTALRVLEIMRRTKRSLFELTAPFERFPQVLRNVKVTEKPPIAELAAVQSALLKHQNALGDDGRILIRYSGTELLCRVMVEGRDRDEIHRISQNLEDLVRQEIGAPSSREG